MDLLRKEVPAKATDQPARTRSGRPSRVPRSQTARPSAAATTYDHRRPLTGGAKASRVEAARVSRLKYARF